MTDVTLSEPTAERVTPSPPTEIPRIGLWTKVAYGFGSVAYGVKDNGFNYFLLLFYSQVIGVNTGWVSTAILVALVADAISDPVVGYWSDNARSRWGRRHPFMYALGSAELLERFRGLSSYRLGHLGIVDASATLVAWSESEAWLE